MAELPTQSFDFRATFLDLFYNTPLIFSLQEEPFLMITYGANNTQVLTGVNMEILEVLAATLNFRYAV